MYTNLLEEAMKVASAGRPPRTGQDPMHNNEWVTFSEMLEVRGVSRAEWGYYLRKAKKECGAKSAEDQLNNGHLIADFVDWVMAFKGRKNYRAMVRHADHPAPIKMRDCMRTYGAPLSDYDARVQRYYRMGNPELTDAEWTAFFAKPIRRHGKNRWAWYINQIQFNCNESDHPQLLAELEKSVAKKEFTPMFKWLLDQSEMEHLAEDPEYLAALDGEVVRRREAQASAPIIRKAKTEADKARRAEVLKQLAERRAAEKAEGKEYRPAAMDYNAHLPYYFEENPRDVGGYINTYKELMVAFGFPEGKYGHSSRTSFRQALRNNPEFTPLHIAWKMTNECGTKTMPWKEYRALLEEKGLWNAGRRFPNHEDDESIDCDEWLQ